MKFSNEIVALVKESYAKVSPREMEKILALNLPKEDKHNILMIILSGEYTKAHSSIFPLATLSSLSENFTKADQKNLLIQYARTIFSSQLYYLLSFSDFLDTYKKYFNNYQTLLSLLACPEIAVNLLGQAQILIRLGEEFPDNKQSFLKLLSDKPQTCIRLLGSVSAFQMSSMLRLYKDFLFDIIFRNQKSVLNIIKNYNLLAVLMSEDQFIKRLLEELEKPGLLSLVKNDISIGLILARNPEIKKVVWEKYIILDNIENTEQFILLGKLYPEFQNKIFANILEHKPDILFEKLSSAIEGTGIYQDQQEQWLELILERAVEMKIQDVITLICNFPEREIILINYVFTEKNWLKNGYDGDALVKLYDICSKENQQYIKQHLIHLIHDSNYQPFLTALFQNFDMTVNVLRHFKPEEVEMILPTIFQDSNLFVANFANLDENRVSILKTLLPSDSPIFTKIAPCNLLPKRGMFFLPRILGTDVIDKYPVPQL